MAKTREMLLDPEEEKLLLPSSSEEEDISDASDNDEPEIKDPFENEDSEVNDPFENEDSDSDGPPIDIAKTFANENEKKFRQHTSQVIKTHIDERKRKRKELHEQYLKRKEEKRQKIDDKKLPDDILENLKDNADEENKETPDNENESEGDEAKDASTNSEDIVAVHGSTVFKCKVLPEEAKKPKQIHEEVMNFKNNLLFGRRIRREKSSRDAMLKREKQIHPLKAVH